MSIIRIERKILEKNDAIASDNRKQFQEKNLLVINLLSSPGSGKTTLIERTITNCKFSKQIAVIEGDVQTELDAERIEKLNIPVVQIVTNGACHLDAQLVRDAFQNLVDINSRLLFIENVGNLVCPAGYNLGEDHKVTVISVTEGEDKPLKYPAVFRNSTALVINKIDLLPYLNISLQVIKSNAWKINPKLEIFEVSCITGEGIEKWCNWLNSLIR
ncbi:MAG: hydrogenase nickel incorporation protein HypB [Ignavibacteria bacterium]